MSEFLFDKIICPYCHGRGLPGGVFSHKDVHFRMETFFEEEEDLNEDGKTLDQIKRMPEGAAKARLQEEVARNLPFLCGTDETYERFWSEFGGTTEEAYGTDKKLLGTLHPSELPILNPSDPMDRQVLKRQQNGGTDAREDYFIYDGDGMVMAVEDIHGKRTSRRLCPSCHNPLPTGYGKFQTKFISVIGITQAGKTVYLSQLLKYMSRYVNYVDMTSYFTSDHESSFINANPVQYGVDLPRPNLPEKLTQPMYYDLVQNVGGGRLKTNTIVLYDIAGENCASPTGMEKFGRFVTKSDGIILLLDPSQLGLAETAVSDSGERATDLITVFNTIHGAFQEQKSDGQLTVPVAVCISKSDMIGRVLPSEFQNKDITPVLHPNSGDPVKKFNASAYNPLEKCLTEQMRTGAGQEVHGALRRGYKNFNYFAFSATGCAVEKREGLSYPKAPPVPLRIAEPLLWLFYKFGYIGSDVPIRLPVQRPMPQTVSQTVKGALPFMKKTVERPLTEEEKERYWYEERT